MGLVSGVQIVLAVQDSLFFCLILQTGVSYHIILMYYLNYEHTGLVQTVLPFTALHYSSHNFSTAKWLPWLTSVLKNKVDNNNKAKKKKTMVFVMKNILNT